MLAEILKYKNAFYFLAGFASAFSLFTIYSFHHQAIGHTSNSPSFPKRKKILFFGDSITQHGYNVEIDGWVAQLAHWWSRRADIINRGYSGYNSRWGRMIIEPIVTEEKPDMIFVFFGANDAVDESVHQFVPLLEYTDNIRSIIRTVRLVRFLHFFFSPCNFNIFLSLLAWCFYKNYFNFSSTNLGRKITRI